MQYNGGKRKIGGLIAQTILRRESSRVWVEPFCGMCSVASEVFKRAPSTRFILSDDNKALINMLSALQRGWVPPTWIGELTNEKYKELRSSQTDSAAHAFIATAMSFGGKWWGGLAGTKNETRNTENFYRAGLASAIRLSGFLKQANVTLRHSDYSSLDIPVGSVVYCDPPYLGTTRIRNTFDSPSFAVWAESTAQDHEVYVSEYTPLSSAFTEILCVAKHDELSKKTGGIRTERLYSVVPL